MPGDRLQIGQVVADRFQIEALIGEGGMGTIYRARHVKLPRVFALKVLKPDLAADPAFLKRFLREAVAMSRVIHPNVVNVTDYGQLPGGDAYIAMELLEGVSLDEEVERLEVLPMDRAVEILIQLADALHCCHDQGIVHRDLKTENVLLCSIRGRQDVVKLLDFGIARMLGPEVLTWKVTQSGMVFGTPEYLSPEQALDRDLDGRSDLYSLGIIAYELVTGSPPFVGRTTEVLKAHMSREPPPPSAGAKERLPPAFDTLVAKLLAKEPANRFQTGGEVVAELQRIRGQRSGQLPQVERNGPGPGQNGRVITEGTWASLAVGRAAPGPGMAAPVSAPVQATHEAAGSETLARTLRTALAAEEVFRQRALVLKELAYSLANRATGDPHLGEALNQILLLENEARGAAQELELLCRQGDSERLESAEHARALRLLLQDAEIRAELTPRSEAAQVAGVAGVAEVAGVAGVAGATGVAGVAEAAEVIALASRLRAQLESLLQLSDQRIDALQREKDACAARLRERETALGRRHAAILVALAPARPLATDRERRLFDRLDHLEAMLAHTRAALGALA